ncbi:MAG TPA: serine acetyltransferase [Mucilaginibacter sp.]|jgi:serine O-acetyltransferase
MKLFKDISKDIKAGKNFYKANQIIIFFNRGFHALLFYRLANKLYKWNIPILPLIFTRIIQIFYSIDIDYKANLGGGIVIVHGVGLVIGAGAQVHSNVVLFHGVTLGRRGIGPTISANDGFPTVEEDCIICTGAVLLGKIIIGKNTTIGANCVVTSNIAANSICKISSDNFINYSK